RAKTVPDGGTSRKARPRGRPPREVLPREGSGGAFPLIVPLRRGSSGTRVSWDCVSYAIQSDSVRCRRRSVDLAESHGLIRPAGAGRVAADAAGHPWGPGAGAAGQGNLRRPE